MTTINHAFEQLRTSLELTDAEQKEASRQQNVVRAKLDQHLGGIDRDFLAGSYSRRTAIRPLNDIDIVLVLNRDTHKDVYPSPSTLPDACLQKVQGALDRAYQARVPIRLQNRSVNIEFKESGIGYDIVPAFVVTGGSYMIPDRKRKSWIETNPEKHRDACVKANERAVGKLNPLVKMAKHCNARAEKRLRSFHLEVMAYEAFGAPPARLSDGLQALLAFLADRVLRTCPNPAGAGPNIDDGMPPEERNAARDFLKRASEQAARALRLERENMTEEAHFLWRDLLGDPYPERGRAPR